MRINKLFSKIKKEKRKLILLSFSLLIVLNFLFLMSIVDIAYSSSESILFNFFENQRTVSGSYDNSYNIEADINGTSNIYNSNLTMSESDIGLFPSFISNVLVDSAYYYNQPYPFYLETPKNITQPSNFPWINQMSLLDNSKLHISTLHNKHNNILNLTHGVGTNDVFLQHYFDIAQTVGTYEFYWCNKDASQSTYLFLLSNSTTIITFNIISDKYYYNNLAGTPIEITGAIPTDNHFAHFKVVFDCSLDTFDLYINETKRVDDGQFRYVTTSINRLYFAFVQNEVGSTFLDAPSEIWHENYIEGQNLKPFKSDYLSVIPYYLGHEYVLYMLDNSVYYERFRIDFDNHMTGNISFWIAINPILANNEIRIRFLDASFQIAGYFFLNNYSLCYYLTYVNNYNLFYSTFTNGVWIHVNFEFDCSTERWHIYFNGIMVANDQVFYNTAYTYTAMNYVEIFSSALAKSEYYFHAFDFSWSDGYYYNRNFFPETIVSPGYQIDNFEFDYNSVDFENNITRFKQSDDANNNVYINKVNDYDSEVVIQNPATYDSTKNKLQMTINLQKYYVKFQTKFEIFNFTKTQDSFWFRFIFPGEQGGWCFDNYISWYSYEGKIWFILDKNQSLSGYSTVFIMELQNNVIYDLQIVFDFESNYYTISIAGNGNSAEYSNMFIGVNFADWIGFNKLELYIDNGNNNHYRNVQIKSLMFKYKSGYNIFDDYTEYEYAQIRYDLGIVDFTLHNLFEFNLTTQAKIIGYNNNFNSSHVFVPFDFLSGFRVYNLYYNYVYYNASIGLNLYGVFYIIPTLTRIFGVGLSYDGKNAYPSYSFIYSNSVNNYYYVAENKLYYRFLRTYTNIAESMSIIFNINDYHIDNNTLLIFGYITNYYLGKVILTDSDLSVSETYSVSTTLQLLEYDIIALDNKNVNRITIKVECLADNIAQGYVDGYISQIYTGTIEPIPAIPIYEFELIETTIVEPDDFRVGMIQVGIQLILFILPTMLGYVLFRSKGIIPMWLLMLIVMFIVSYIPFWMVIIQVIAIIGMIILPKNESEVDND